MTAKKRSALRIPSNAEVASKKTSPWKRWVHNYFNFSLAGAAVRQSMIRVKVPASQLVKTRESGTAHR